jgi:putative flippase GtrA
VPTRAAAINLTTEIIVLRMPASKFYRYALFGSVAVAVHLTIMILLIEQLVMAEPIASQIGLLTGIVTNYFLQRTYTFSSNVSHVVALPLFLIMSLIGTVINFVIFGALLPYMHYVIAQCIAILVVFLMNFTISNTFLFRQRN